MDIFKEMKSHFYWIPCQWSSDGLSALFLHICSFLSIHWHLLTRDTTEYDPSNTRISQELRYTVQGDRGLLKFCIKYYTRGNQHLVCGTLFATYISALALHSHCYTIRTRSGGILSSEALSLTQLMCIQARLSTSLSPNCRPELKRISSNNPCLIRSGL
jgi:hypothetical protein